VGGKASSSVRRNGDHLTVGKDLGSKLDKARQLGVKVLTEPEFERLIGR